MTTDGTDPIQDDEILYRRVPVSLDLYTDGTLSPAAFEPRKEDVTGLSIARAKYATPEQVAAKGPSKKGYFIVELSAGAMRQNGIKPEPKPEPNDPGHSEIVNLTALNFRTDACQGMMASLATVLCGKVHGPYSGTPPAK